SPVVLAPMAGVTDRPFRLLCRALGAGLAASEMITSDMRLWHTSKSRQRMDHGGEPEPRVVQLAGADPARLAAAARANVALGAQIIDLNMGCPAKKVCGRLCGSALLRDEALVAQILHAVVSAVDVPVTLKIRTGWDREHTNGVQIARIARKHLGWYCELLDEPAQIRGELMGAANTAVQFAQALKHFEHWVGAAAAAA